MQSIVKSSLAATGCILLACLYTISAYAQSARDSGKLRIGDTVPDIELANLINYPKPAINLADLRGKVTILDFWTTFCIPCIQAFPKMGELQREYDEELQFLLITRQDSPTVEHFLTRYAGSQNEKFHLPVATSSNTIQGLFDFTYIPHYIWIGKDGKIIAITNGEAVTEENVSLAINGKSLAHLPIKKDFTAFDRTKPLLTNFTSGDIPGIIHQSLLTERLEGLTRSPFLLNDANKKELSRVYHINSSIVQLFTATHSMETMSYPDSRVILEVKEPARLRWLAESGITLNEWSRANTYCYELITSPASVPEIRKRVMQDLERQFSLVSGFETQSLMCWVVTRKEGVDYLPSNGKENDHNFYALEKAQRYMKNLPFSVLMNFLNGPKTSPILYVDETGLTDNLDLTLPVDLGDFAAVNAALAEQGFRIEKTSRDIKVLVIKDK